MCNINIYVFDTSAISILLKKYPASIFQSLYPYIDLICQEKRVLSPPEVRRELLRSPYDSPIYLWTKEHDEIFTMTESCMDNVKTILKKFPSLAKPQMDTPHADPWVIALAMEDKQATLVEHSPYVVSEEKINNHCLRIPYVCEKMGVQHMDLIDFFLAEKIKI